MAQADRHSHLRVPFAPPTFRKTEQVEAEFPCRVVHCLHGLTSDLLLQDYLLDNQRLNDIADLDAHLAEVNAQLAPGQYFIGCADHTKGYDLEIFSKEGGLKGRLQRLGHFIFHRVMPRVKGTRRVHRTLFGPRGRHISKTEVLGRLVYHGFDIDTLDYESDTLCFKAVKIGTRRPDCTPTNGPLIRLDRMVKGGRMCKIYKLRTMHPYSEFIQEFVYQQNKLEEGGKIKDDFRVSEEGRLFRKYFLDELPMLINLIKGDIKLIGVRPLSAHYFSLYSDELQELRRKHKPGLLPPYYSEERKPATMEEIMDSERRYLLSYAKSPIRTDITYFFRIWNNILIKKLRSQ